MTEETTNNPQPGSPEAEQAQQDVSSEVESSTTEAGEQAGEQEQGDKQEGKDPNAWALDRIGKLTRQRHEAERAAEQAKAEAQRYRQLMEQMQQGGEQEQPAKAPQSQQEIDELVNKRAEQVAQQREMTARGQSVAATGATEFTEAEFTKSVQTLDALGISNEQVHQLLGLEDAHKVIYNLGKNPEEASRILSLPPLQQGRELERLSAKLANAPDPKPVSKAPAPVRPIDSGSAAEKDPSKMSTTEWIAWRNKTTQNRF